MEGAEHCVDSPTSRLQEEKLMNEGEFFYMEMHSRLCDILRNAWNLRLAQCFFLIWTMHASVLK